jgi:hypothetical protein
MLVVLSTIDRELGFTAVQGRAGRRIPILVDMSVSLPMTNPKGTNLLTLIHNRDEASMMRSRPFDTAVFLRVVYLFSGT